jgi:uncharacterized protein (TIRG00374 family)
MAGKKQTLITIAKFAASFGILGYLFYNAWQQNQFQQVAAATKRWEWWLIGLTALLAATAISFYRWWALVRALEIPFRLADAMRLGFISQLFNLLSIGVFGGDAMRAVAAARQVPHRMPEAVASVVIDRAIGLLTMFMFCAAAYWLTDFSAIHSLHPRTLEAVRAVCLLATVLSIAGCVGLVLLLVLPGVNRWPLYRAVTSLPRVGSTIKRLLNVVLIYRRSKPELFCAFLNSMSVNALLAISIYAVAHGISDSHPSLLQHLVISPIVMVANAAPLPGGLGGMEFSLDVLYKAFSQSDVPSEHGFIVALGYRVMLLIIAGIGVVYYFLQPPKMVADSATAGEI